MARRTYVYHLYGYCLHSHIPLPCPETEVDNSLPQIELVQGSAPLFKQAHKPGGILAEDTETSERVDMADGSIYLRWFEHFEFLIAPGGHRICWRALNGSTSESLYYHLLGPVLSYAMLVHGIEPLHATALDIDGKGVALLGDSGTGKSALAAAFVQAGYKLLTDDVLVLRRDNGRCLAYPGLPRLKLYKDMARYIFGDVTGVPMNRWTTKHILRLGAECHQPRPIPMHALYLVSTPSPDVRGVFTRRCVAKRALVHLLRHTYNGMVTDSPRLKRQLLFCTAVVKGTPVKFLSYPRQKQMLGRVVAKITEDVEHPRVCAAGCGF